MVAGARKSILEEEITTYIVAALVVSSIVFVHIDNPYFHRLLERARSLFHFVDQYHRTYGREFHFYFSFSGYGLLSYDFCPADYTRGKAVVMTDEEPKEKSNKCRWETLQRNDFLIS
jgi:hypothetical protein